MPGANRQLIADFKGFLQSPIFKNMLNAFAVLQFAMCAAKNIFSPRNFVQD
jgi:hypothetical protein